MAVEDGGIIGNLIGRLNRELVKGVIPQSRRHESINTVLGLYEQSQKHRTTVNVKGATSNGYFFHLPDGSEQEDRDKELASIHLQMRSRGICGLICRTTSSFLTPMSSAMRAIDSMFGLERTTEKLI